MKNNFKYNRKIVLRIIILIFIIFNTNKIRFVSSEENYIKIGEISVNSRIASRNIWVDSMWIFYKVSVEKNQTLIVNMTYSGDLDLDLRFYVDEDPTTQKVMAWDITHCGLDDAKEIQEPNKPKRNSQERGTSATEQCIYTNYIFIKPRIVYILVFCYEHYGYGGKSSYTLSSNLKLEDVNYKELIKSKELTIAWNIYFIGVGFTIIIAIMISNYLKIPRKERKMRKIKKKEEKQRKMEDRIKKMEQKEAQKRRTSMKRRVSSTRKFR